MHHIAIMNPKYFIDKILSGEKKIETRWYLHKRTPWDRIKKDDTVFFKESSGMLRAKADVEKVLQFGKSENLFEKNNFNAKVILEKYGSDIFIENYNLFYEAIRNKNYAILVFLKNPIAIEPFQINKKGFGNACAWITIKNINKIKQGE